MKLAVKHYEHAASRTSRICSSSPFPLLLARWCKQLGDLVGLGLAFSTLTNSVSDPKKKSPWLYTSRSLLSNCSGRKSHSDFGFNWRKSTSAGISSLRAFAWCIEKGTDFTTGVKILPPPLLSVSLKKLLNLTNPQSNSLWRRQYNNHTNLRWGLYEIMYLKSSNSVE